MRNKGFLLYPDMFDMIDMLTMEERGQLLTAIYHYKMGYSLPKMELHVQMAFGFIRNALDRDSEKYEEICRKRSEAGRKGGKAINE